MIFDNLTNLNSGNSKILRYQFLSKSKYFSNFDPPFWVRHLDFWKSDIFKLRELENTWIQIFIGIEVFRNSIRHIGCVILILENLTFEFRELENADKFFLLNSDARFWFFKTWYLIQIQRPQETLYKNCDQFSLWKYFWHEVIFGWSLKRLKHGRQTHPDGIFESFRLLAKALEFVHDLKSFVCFLPLIFPPSLVSPSKAKNLRKHGCFIVAKRCDESSGVYNKSFIPQRRRFAFIYKASRNSSFFALAIPCYLDLQVC